MFLIEPFCWMFKVKNFVKQFVLLVLIGVVSYLLTVLAQFLLENYVGIEQFIPHVILQVLSFVLLIVPALLLSGYFWCLADNIIDREQIPVANNVYNGKVKSRYIIELPDFNVQKFVWRGISSIFATIVLCIPYIYLITSSSGNFQTALEFWGLDTADPIIIGVVVFVVLGSVVPALFWNYARRDSILAVLNIFKASHIIMAYPAQYLINTLLFVLSTAIQAGIIILLAGLLGFTTELASITLPTVMDSIKILYGITFVIFLIISYIISVFGVFINAYLLGTIAPPSEY